MMRHLITVEAATTTDDGLGGQTVVWSEAFKWWADVSGVRGREFELQGRLVTAETYLFTGHVEDRITTHHRLIFNGKVMNIRSVQNRDGRRHRTTVEAEAGGAT
jgi:SPP1 family predicted phage head-tail adaptor